MEKKRRKVSIYDIAKALNTSGATVSRALHDHSSISIEMKEMVRKVAKEMNYRPNTVAINLKRGKCNTIGVVVPNIHRNFFSSAIDGIEEEAYKIGYDVLICQSRESYEREKKILNSLSRGKVDGVIASIASGTSEYSHYTALEDCGIPLVLFDRMSDRVNAGSVTIDDFRGAYHVVEHLFEQGRRRIFHYAGFQHVSVWYNRYRGYMQAMQSHGIEPGEDWVFIGDTSEQAGVMMARQVLKMKQRPDAIFCTSDFVALGCMLELIRNGVRVPDEIAVCGFADEPMDALISPSLTSVNQFSKKMGQQAARMLIDRLNGEPAVNIMLEPELIIRDSTLAKKS